jgi:hypothetical protein
MAAAAVFRDVCGTEGVEGNVHASRAWKGNNPPRASARLRAVLLPHKKALFAVRLSLFARVSGDDLRRNAKCEMRKAKSE